MSQDKDPFAWARQVSQQFQHQGDKFKSISNIGKGALAPYLTQIEKSQGLVHNAVIASSAFSPTLKKNLELIGSYFKKILDDNVQLANQYGIVPSLSEMLNVDSVEDLSSQEELQERIIAAKESLDVAVQKALNGTNVFGNEDLWEQILKALQQDLYFPALLATYGMLEGFLKQAKIGEITESLEPILKKKSITPDSFPDEIGSLRIKSFATLAAVSHFYAKDNAEQRNFVTHHPTPSHDYQTYAYLTVFLCLELLSLASNFDATPFSSKR